MDYWIGIADQALIFAVFAVSLNLLLGHSGQISVAHAAFGAIGGYASVCAATYWGWGSLASTALAVVIAGIAGAAVAVPALRLSREYLILLTVALASIVSAVSVAVSAFGGSYGLLAPEVADFAPLPTGELLYPADWLPWLVAVLLVVLAVCWRLGESPWGRVLRAIREDDLAARSIGKDVYAFKVIVFAVTSAMAGLAGSLLYSFNQLASPDVYGFDVSLAIFAMVIFGGTGNLLGSVLGAFLLTLIQPLLVEYLVLDPEQSFLIQSIVYGFLLLLVIRFRPEGLLPERIRRGRRDAAVLEALAEAPAGVRTAPRAESDDSDEGTVAVSARGVSKSFGGIVAVDGFEADLHCGEVTALIGPNGAGKTTVFNLLTGALPMDAGSVTVAGVSTAGLRPDRVAQLGMVRSFQDVRLFGALSVLDNVAVAAQRPASAGLDPDGEGRLRGGERVRDLFLHPRVVSRVEDAARERAARWLDVVGMAHVAHERAADLSYGQQKLVTIARLLATEADVLLLDEPLSGVDPTLVDQVLSVVGDIAARGKAVCIIEHSLHVVEKLADTVCFMETGRVTARGSVAEIVSDQRLAEVYFGTI